MDYILPEGYEIVKLNAGNGHIVEVAMNYWVPPHDPEKRVKNYHCLHCAFSHTYKDKMLDHANVTAAEPSLHLYGWPYGINPFTGLPMEVEDEEEDE